MQLATLHSHTNFCDGTDDIESCCRAAYQKGLKYLGFSAHAPITRKTGIPSAGNLDDNRLEEYLDAVRAAQRRWEGKLPVYLGLEIEYIHGLIGPADREYMKMGLDFTIGAVHFLLPPKGAPFTVDDQAEVVERGIKEGFSGDSMGMVEMYMDYQEAIIRAGGFDVLAHPDLIKKNNISPDGLVGRIFCEDNDFYRRKTKTLAELMGKSDNDQTRIIEVNTGGMNRGKTRDCYPSLPFLKLFRKQGVSAIINSDANCAEHLDGYYEEARKTMLAAAYTETVLFEGREDGKAVWRSIKL